jgi:hypothetical protein
MILFIFPFSKINFQQLDLADVIHRLQATIQPAPSDLIYSKSSSLSVTYKHRGGVSNNPLISPAFWYDSLGLLALGRGL